MSESQPVQSGTPPTEDRAAQTPAEYLRGVAWGTFSRDGEVSLLNAAIREKDEALRWYAEQARLCRLIHSEGDAGRHALAADGGKRARKALGHE